MWKIIAMPSVSDSILLQNLKKGQSEAFNECYKRYRKLLMATAFAILQNEADAQDVVQEFFLDFWEKQSYKNIDVNSPIEGFRGFLIIAVKNRCINQLSKNDTRRRHLKDILLAQEATALPPDDRLEQQQQQHELTSTLQQLLHPQSFKVVELAYLHGKNRKEIALETGTSPNTIRNQLVHALKVLRKNLRRL
jgi:RNA polymerase sigma-70 factor (ECF subfamily)